MGPQTQLQHTEREHDGGDGDCHQESVEDGSHRGDFNGQESDVLRVGLLGDLAFNASQSPRE